MEEETTKQSKTAEASKTSLKETLQSGSPDEVKDRVKSVVEKGVAAVAGALQGFNRGTEKNDIPGQTKGAIHQAAETTKGTVSSVTEEISNLREPLKEAGQKLSQSARDMRSTVREQVDQTKSAARFGSQAPGIGEDAQEAGFGRGVKDASGELPDISHTALAQPDKKLLGKDLTEDLGNE